MIGLLLRTRARRLRNFIRHHFDAGTLLHVLFDALRDAGRVGWLGGPWPWGNLVRPVNGCTGGQ